MATFVRSNKESQAFVIGYRGDCHIILFTRVLAGGQPRLTPNKSERLHGRVARVFNIMAITPSFNTPFVDFNGRYA